MAAHYILEELPYNLKEDSSRLEEDCKCTTEALQEQLERLYTQHEALKSFQKNIQHSPAEDEHKLQALELQ
jgi:hypothetical protein